MTRCILTSFVLCVSLACVAINPAGAAEKKAKEGQINGRVQMIEKDKATIVVKKGTTQRQTVPILTRGVSVAGDSFSATVLGMRVEGEPR
jgi:hypothetical protein